MATLKQIRYFTTGVASAGWYYTLDSDNTMLDPTLASAPIDLNNTDAERIIIDGNTLPTVAHVINGGGGNDEFYIEHDVPDGIEIADSTGINTIIFAADKVEAGTTTSIDVKSVELRHGSLEIVEVTLTITTDDGTTPATTREATLGVENFLRDSNTGAITQFAFEGGALSNRVLTAQELKNYIEGTPTFTKTLYSVDFPEDRDIVADNSVLTVSALDVDHPSGVTYSITEGNADGYFAIDGNGAITFNTANLPALDHETVSQYTFIVRASDGTKHSDVQVIVNVGNVNEHAVVWDFLGGIDDSSFTGKSLPEQTVYADANPVPTGIQFSVTDADAGAVYTADDFSINDARFDVIADPSGVRDWIVVLLPDASIDDDEYSLNLMISARDGDKTYTQAHPFFIDNGQAEFKIVRVIPARYDGNGNQIAAETTVRLGDGGNDDILTVGDRLIAEYDPHDRDVRFSKDPEEHSFETDGDGRTGHTIVSGARFQWHYTTAAGERVEIAGATDVSYTLGIPTVGHDIGVDIIYEDGRNRTEIARVVIDSPVLRGNVAPTIAVTGTPKLAEGDNPVTGLVYDLYDDKDTDAQLTFELVNPPSGFRIDPVHGTIVGETDYESMTPNAEGKRSIDLSVRVTDTSGLKSNIATFSVEITNRQEGPGHLSIHRPGNKRIPDLESGDVLTVAFGRNDPDGFAEGTTHTYHWYRQVNGVETAEPIFTGTTYTLTDDDISTPGSNVNLIARTSFTDAIGVPQTAQGHIVSVGASRDAVIGIRFFPVAQTAEELTANRDSLGVQVIHEDPDGYAEFVQIRKNVLDYHYVQYNWYRVINGVEESSAFHTSTKRQSENPYPRRNLETDDLRGMLGPDDISTADRRVDIIVRVTYTDAGGYTTTVEGRLDHIGIAAPTTANAPVIDATTTSFLIDEGVHDGSHLFTVTATDTEKDTIRFSLVNNPPAGFAIDAVSGAISFTGTVPPDRTEAYTLTVQAADHHGNTSTQAFTTSFNTPPTLTIAGSVSITENADHTTTPLKISGTGAPITITATDAEAHTLTYSLVDAPAGFSIDPATGDITFTGSLNYEDYTSTNGVLTLTLAVTDSQGSAPIPTTADIQINVVNVNEGDADIRLTNTAPRVGDILRVRVDKNDPDGNGNLADANSAQHQWRSRDDDTSAWQDIPEATGASYEVPAGAEGKFFSVLIDYSDGSQSPESVTAATTTGAIGNSLTLDGRFFNGGNQIPLELDVDGAWSNLGANILPKYVLARYTGDPTLTVSYINKAGIKIDSPIVREDSFFSQTDVPPYWTGFDLTFDGRREISLDFRSIWGRAWFDTGEDVDSVRKGSADSLLPTGVIQDFTITATYGNAAPKTVDFQLKLVDNDDGFARNKPAFVASTTPNYDDRAAYTYGTSADETALEANSGDADHDNGARSGTFYINDIDAGDTYTVVVNGTTITESVATTITGTLGVLTVTLNNREVDWNYQYNDGIGAGRDADGGRVNDRFHFTATDEDIAPGSTSNSAGNPTASGTPLTFTLITRPEGPLYDTAGAGSFTFSVDENDTEVGTIITTTALDASYAISAGNENGLFAINDEGEITLTRTLDFETDAKTYAITVAGTDRNGTLPVNVNINLENVDETRSTYTITGTNADSTDTDLENLAIGWTLTVTETIPDPEGVDRGQPMIYRWFHADDDTGNIGGDSASYTIKVSDVGARIGVGVTYTDNNREVFEVIQILGENHIVGREFTVENPNADNTLTLPDNRGSEVNAGDGSDSVTDGSGDDVIDGGRGDDDIDLGGSSGDSDTIIYGIGDQTAQGGGDDITDFERGRDKFIFSLEASTETNALTNLAEFINYIGGGTPNDLSDDQFRVTFALDFPEDISATTAEVKGIYLHFSNGVFYSGGRISMPILEIGFSENLPDNTIINDVFGGDVSNGIDSVSGLVKLEYLNALLGGNDEFDAIGFQVVAPDAI